MNKRRFAYKQGIVNTIEHSTLLKGQVVEILEESGEYYRVRVFINAKIETVNKKDIIVN